MDLYTNYIYIREIVIGNVNRCPAVRDAAEVRGGTAEEGAQSGS